MADTYGLTPGQAKWGKRETRGDKSGKLTIIAKRHCLRQDEKLFLPSKGLHHPDFSFAEYETHTSKSAGKMVTFTITFVGLPPRFIEDPEDDDAGNPDPGNFPQMPDPV